MASCCPTASEPAPVRLDLPCPACGVTGRTVASSTVRNIVKPDRVDAVGQRDHNLCLGQKCPVSYYSRESTLHETDLRVSLWCKDDSPNRVVCYCHKVKAADILGEMATNPEARSFADIQRIFSLSNCDCASSHPLGGSCACAGDIGRLVKLGRRQLGIEEKEKSVEMQLQQSASASVTKPALWLYESEVDCCGNSSGKPLFEFLSKRCSDFADLRHINLSGDDEQVPVPAAVLEALESKGAAALPLLYFDGAVLYSGQVPNFLNAMGAINERRRRA